MPDTESILDPVLTRRVFHDVEFERTMNTVRLREVPTGVRFIFGCILASSLFFTYWGWRRAEWLLMAFGVLGTVIAPFGMMSRSKQFLFDLKRREIRHQTLLPFGLGRRTQSIAFDDVAGLKILEQSLEDGTGYVPIIELKGGKCLTVATSKVGLWPYRDLLQQLSIMTKLPLLVP